MASSHNRSFKIGGTSRNPNFPKNERSSDGTRKVKVGERTINWHASRYEVLAPPSEMSMGGGI